MCEPLSFTCPQDQDDTACLPAGVHKHPAAGVPGAHRKLVAVAHGPEGQHTGEECDLFKLV